MTILQTLEYQVAQLTMRVIELEFTVKQLKEEKNNSRPGEKTESGFSV